MVNGANDRIMVNEAIRNSMRSKRTCIKAIKKDMLMGHVIEDMTLNKVE